MVGFLPDAVHESVQKHELNSSPQLLRNLLRRERPQLWGASDQFEKNAVPGCYHRLFSPS